MGVPTSTDAVPSVPARRLRRPSWRDPRLLVGLLLVLGATVAGGLLVAGADDTVPVLAARDTLVRGDVLGEDDLRVVRVRLDDVAASYLPAATPLAAGSVALRTVPAGELLPASAVGRLEELESRPVALDWQGPRPEGLVPGAAVDLWVAAREGTSEFGEPELLVGAADVYAVVEGDGGLGSQGGTQVQVMLEPDGVRSLLAALAAEDRIDLVLVPGPRG
ncbi:SAF domain-containing protein [Aquipuribacter hungaricus]|uniref:SAF domain-containing protein n=1 Tax=Aquipuribacter hungaricus TaxID=545624 RepID=A0ABV7WF16_9MICO